MALVDTPVLLVLLLLVLLEYIIELNPPIITFSFAKK